MKKEERLALFKSYDDAVCTIDNTECWSARELCTLLGYQQWCKMLKNKNKYMNNKEHGYVYILINPSFRENWLKIIL